MALPVPVVRYKRRKKLSDPSSPELHYLRPRAGSGKTHTLKHIARDIANAGPVGPEEVEYVLGMFVKKLQSILADGDRAKIPDLGTFYTTFNCNGVKEKKDCTVKNIYRVNTRFKADAYFRLAGEGIQRASEDVEHRRVHYYVAKEPKTEKVNGDAPPVE